MKAPCVDESVVNLVEVVGVDSLAIVVVEPEKVTPLKMVFEEVVFNVQGGVIRSPIGGINCGQRGFVLY